MSEDDRVRPIRPGLPIPGPLDGSDEGRVGEWKTALTECLGDGGMDGGVVLWRDPEGKVSYMAVGWDLLQVGFGLHVAVKIAENEAGAPTVSMEF